MPRTINWRDLRVGIFSAIGLAVLLLIILLFAQVGGLRGKKATLYIVAADATGVLTGTDIWLAGQKIGSVQDVRFRPVNADTSERLLIEAQILAERLSPIRRDSRAEIKPGASMIGIPVVFITAGSLKSPGIRDGDTIRAAPATQVAKLGDSISAANTEVRALAKEVRTLTTNISSSKGTVGALRSAGMPPMANVQSRLTALTDRASNGNGSIGLATRGNLGARVSRALAGVDSIKALVASDRGSLGRFRRDSTLPRTIAGMMAQVDSLSAILSDPVGAIAKAHKDSVLVRALAGSHASMDSLMRDIKKHPLRYIAF